MPPPAGNPMTMRMGREGNACASRLGAQQTEPDAAPSTKARLVVAMRHGSPPLQFPIVGFLQVLQVGIIATVRSRPVQQAGKEDACDTTAGTRDLMSTPERPATRHGSAKTSVRPSFIRTAIPACIWKRASGRSQAIPQFAIVCSPAPTWACSAGTSERRVGRTCPPRCRTSGRSPSILPTRIR